MRRIAEHHLVPMVHVYETGYLNKKGNIKYCWKIHKDKMTLLGLPYVEYNAFYNRLKTSKWDLYRAIHTPLDYSKLEWHEKARVYIRTKWLQFKSLFKKDGRIMRGNKRRSHIS